MSGGTPGTTQVNQGAGTRDPGYGAARDFYNSLLGISQQPYPNQYPGQLDPGMSPTMQNAIRMGQGYASSGPPSIMGAAQGALGQFMSPNFQNPFARIFGGGGGAPNYFPGNNSPMFNNSSQGSMGFLGSNPFMSLGGSGQTPPWMPQEPFNIPGQNPGMATATPQEPWQNPGAGGPTNIDPTQIQGILDAMMKMQSLGGGAMASDPYTIPGSGDQPQGPAPDQPQGTAPNAGTQFPLNPGGASGGGGSIPYEPPVNGPNVGYPGMPGYDGKTPMDPAAIAAWVNQQRGGRTSPFAPPPAGLSGAGVSGAAPPPRSPLPTPSGGVGTSWQPGGGVSATRPNRRPRPLPTWAPKPLPPPAPIQPKPPAPGGGLNPGAWPTGGTPPQGPLPPFTGVDPGTGWWPGGGR